MYITLELGSTSITSSVTWKRDHQRTLIYNVSETFFVYWCTHKHGYQGSRTDILRKSKLKVFWKTTCRFVVEFTRWFFQSVFDLCFIDVNVYVHQIYPDNLPSIKRFCLWGKRFISFRFSLIYKAVERHKKGSAINVECDGYEQRYNGLSCICLMIRCIYLQCV